MSGICPHCERETAQEFVRSSEVFQVRGEPIEVPVEFLRCLECHQSLDDPRATTDPVDEAYRIYRRRHSLLQPEQIRDFRKTYGLTQRELSTLLGWGGATLSRYENGALQDDAHDRLLRLIMAPRNLLDLIDQNATALTAPRIAQLRSALADLQSSSGPSLRAICEDHFARYEADQLSGFSEFSIDKFASAILFFSASRGVFKTKLNKLLFYADFKHCKDFAVSITGARYAHMPYGPAPDHYELFLALLQDEDHSIAIEEREFPEYVGELVVARTPPDIAAFAPSELKVLSLVMHSFETLTAKELSDRSHQESAYRQTRLGDLIPYTHANDLSL